MRAACCCSSGSGLPHMSTVDVAALTRRRWACLIGCCGGRISGSGVSGPDALGSGNLERRYAPRCPGLVPGSAGNLWPEQRST